MYLYLFIKINYNQAVVKESLVTGIIRVSVPQVGNFLLFSIIHHILIRNNNIKILNETTPIS
jgi:hypothetical protein